VFEWSEEQLAVRDAVRRFVESEVKPRVDELEHGDLPPYEIIRKLYSTFGMDQLARESFKRSLQRKRDEGAGDTIDGSASGAPPSASPQDASTGGRGDGGAAAMTLIPIIELSRFCPGIVTAMGVSIGLAAGTVMKRGTSAQLERWGQDLMTLDKIGAWAITEPDSGSDALGGMKASARPDGDEFVLNGSKTFITNGPFADTIVFYAKLDDGSGVPARDRPVLTFVLDSGTPGLVQSKPLRKMGLHSSPTGELFLTDVRVGRDHLLGDGGDDDGALSGSAGAATAADDGRRRVRDEGRQSARDNFVTERAGVAAMSLGLIEECLALSVDYARERRLWGRPIAEFQLVQLKLATMEVARLNVQNLVFRHIEMQAAGKSLSLAEASAMKLYSARAASEVAMEAVQLFGGNGYMSEFRVEQLARDAKVFQIYAGTDEIQITHIARDLLSR
jgi:alkylation response protein AidB-like acyl-CoA dehydrogenase